MVIEILCTISKILSFKIPLQKTKQAGVLFGWRDNGWRDGGSEGGMEGWVGMGWTREKERFNIALNAFRTENRQNRF